MHSVQVHINGVIVYQVPCRPDKSIMRGHELFKMYCIPQLNKRGIEATVIVIRDNGEFTNVKKVQIEYGYIYVESKMNDPDFVLPPCAFDDALDMIPPKHEYDE